MMSTLGRYHDGDQIKFHILFIFKFVFYNLKMKEITIKIPEKKTQLFYGTGSQSGF